VHQLNSVTVTNYRSIKECHIPLNQVTPIVGYNNAGKSNLLSAIKWLVSPFKLEESAFFDPNKELSVEGEIAGVNENILGSCFL
jgi:putative ATP-dependent endonuclease of OLD family